MLLFAVSLKSLHNLMSMKPHLLHEVVNKECLGKVAVIVGTFSSERVQLFTLKYCTYQIDVWLVFMYSQLFVFAELTVADNGFHKAWELYLVREYLVQ